MVRILSLRRPGHPPRHPSAPRLSSVPPRHVGKPVLSLPGRPLSQGFGKHPFNSVSATRSIAGCRGLPRRLPQPGFPSPRYSVKWCRPTRQNATHRTVKCSAYCGNSNSQSGFCAPVSLSRTSVTVSVNSVTFSYPRATDLPTLFLHLAGLQHVQGKHFVPETAPGSAATDPPRPPGWEANLLGGRLPDRSCPDAIQRSV